MLGLLREGNIDTDDWCAAYPKLGDKHHYYRFVTARMAYMIHFKIGFGLDSFKCRPLTDPAMFHTWAHFASKTNPTAHKFCDNCGSATRWLDYRT